MRFESDTYTLDSANQTHRWCFGRIRLYVGVNDRGELLLDPTAARQLSRVLAIAAEEQESYNRSFKPDGSVRA